MFDFIYSLMTDKKNGEVYAPFKFILYIVSLGYGAAIFVRELLYKYKIFRTEKVPLKIISVGNLTLGGTGKTPFVIELVRILKENLKKDASVLIRGYGWDEQTMLKTNLPDVPILVGSDRVASAHRAIRLYGSDTAILDDGFQYWELERSLNIVLIDARNPYGNRQLFPRGVLREPVSAIKRADIVVFTKIDKSVRNIAGMMEELFKFNKDLIFLKAYHSPRSLYNAKARKEFGLSFLKGKRVALLSSIGDPSYFADTVAGLGAEIAEHIIYPDHHNYKQKHVDKIMRRLSEKSFDLIVTTEKDAVKLHRMSLSFGDYTLMTLAIEMKITDGKELLIDRLNSLYSRKGA